jgi:hypothetical protein
VKANMQILGKTLDRVCPVSSGQKFDSICQKSQRCLDQFPNFLPRNNKTKLSAIALPIGTLWQITAKNSLGIFLTALGLDEWSWIKPSNS